jgi:hypothetical protein
MKTMRKRRIVKALAFLPIFLILFAGMIWAVFGLWNWLMPSIFGLHTVTYWQALGLMVLSWILFRGLRPRFDRDPWGHGIRERWRKMTPAEREEFMKGLRSRFGGTSSPEADPNVATDRSEPAP